MEKKHVGHYIAEWRQYKEMTQTQLAAEIGVSPSNIHHIEHGKTAYTQQSLEKIADALKTSPASLIATNPWHPSQFESDEEESPFMDDVHKLLLSMSLLSRKLAHDFLKSLVQYETTQAKIRDAKMPEKMMKEAKLAKDYRIRQTLR